MRSFIAVLLPILLAAGCAESPPVPFAVGPSACRSTQDGAPPAGWHGGPIAERGIGGTGIPVSDRGSGGTGGPLADRGTGGTGGPLADRATGALLADRGSGGTGGPAEQADRGIGGTGVIGVVSGFASVCVDGLEIGLDPATPVRIDGEPSNVRALRAGDVVAIAAHGLRATSVAIRHEVSGPVDDVITAHPMLIAVAGQRVRVPAEAQAGWIRRGVWVAVSGLRGADGDIVATRIDPRKPGPVTVHGPLLAMDGEASIGGLRIRRPSADHARVAGAYTTATGTYVNGMLEDGALTPDLVISDPLAAFGDDTRTVIMAGYARFEDGRVSVPGGFSARLAAGVEPPVNQSGPIVLVLRKSWHGGVSVIDARGAAPIYRGMRPTAHNQRPGGSAAPEWSPDAPPDEDRGPGSGEPGQEPVSSNTTVAAPGTPRDPDVSGLVTRASTTSGPAATGAARGR